MKILLLLNISQIIALALSAAALPLALETILKISSASTSESVSARKNNQWLQRKNL
ncbi:MAG: hypothetical protein PVI26_01225 [Chitinispirillia bacterium]